MQDDTVVSEQDVPRFEREVEAVPILRKHPIERVQCCHVASRGLLANLPIAAMYARAVVERKQATVDQLKDRRAQDGLLTRRHIARTIEVKGVIKTHELVVRAVQERVVHAMTTRDQRFTPTLGTSHGHECEGIGY